MLSLFENWLSIAPDLRGVLLVWVSAVLEQGSLVDDFLDSQMVFD
jgi:hypothetical protein